MSDFNPRSPCGERHGRFFHHVTTDEDFNPRSPCGERRTEIYREVTTGSFQPTLPMRGATSPTTASVKISSFQPTLPMRGATILMATDNYGFIISTHAPHAGSDFAIYSQLKQAKGFQPTLPMRGATSRSTRS